MSQNFITISGKAHLLKVGYAIIPDVTLTDNFFIYAGKKDIKQRRHCSLLKEVTKKKVTKTPKYVAAKKS